MTATRPHPPHGFTLVELLVVASLMAGMLALVLATSRPDPSGEIRRFTQLLSSSVLATQTRALGKEGGAALVLASPSGATPAANEVFFADVPPMITGSIAVPPNAPIISSTAGLLTLSPDNADSVEEGYRIRFLNAAPFMPRSQWFRFSPVASGLSGTASFDVAASQTARNAIWPMTSGTSLSFEIARFPRASTSAFKVIQQVGIDLRYSGVGDNPSTPFGTLSGVTPICVCYDRTGRLDCLIGSPVSLPRVPFKPTAPLYLLLASLADIQTDEALRSESSRWLVLAPGTGRAFLSKNVPVPGNTAADVFAARLLARTGVSIGGR